jgi:exopolyphosphatase / guanosine-5'-triphosphate,3'-diphosphate pyrophosphatase
MNEAATGPGTERLAAIDIGSNAIRLVVGELDSYGDIRVLKKIREPIRLGKDVFSQGEISEKTKSKAIEAFMKFRSILDDFEVGHTKAVATSALREARDRDQFVRDVHIKSGISIKVIDGIEEGRLIFSAVAQRMKLEDTLALLIDFGGGSVELTISDHGKPKATQTFKMGGVRILQIMQDRGLREQQMPQLIQEMIPQVRSFLGPYLKGHHFDLAIGTGGNFECLGKLRVAVLHKTSIFSMSYHEVQSITEHLMTLSIKERMDGLRLKSDRADVIVPAALLTQAIMETAEIDLLNVPHVGLREGILADLGKSLRQ